AMAGLKRLGEDHRATSVVDPEHLMPAPAQGAIGIAIRSGDSRFADLVAPLDHTPTHRAIAAERAMLAVLDGSCRTPVGALTTGLDAALTLSGEILSINWQTSLRADASDGDPEAIFCKVGEAL